MLLGMSQQSFILFQTVNAVFCHSKYANCPPSDAWVPNKDDGSSLRFCNAANVGLVVTFCP